MFCLVSLSQNKPSVEIETFVPVRKIMEPPLDVRALNSSNSSVLPFINQYIFIIRTFKTISHEEMDSRSGVK